MPSFQTCRVAPLCAFCCCSVVRSKSGLSFTAHAHRRSPPCCTRTDTGLFKTDGLAAGLQAWTELDAGSERVEMFCWNREAGSHWRRRGRKKQNDRRVFALSRPQWKRNLTPSHWAHSFGGFG
ncbi:hypothetical protein MHYP_G00080580 [Metynnis hypsauchen]